MFLQWFKGPRSKVCLYAASRSHSVLMPKGKIHNSGNNSSGSTESNKLKVKSVCLVG